MDKDKKAFRKRTNDLLEVVRQSSGSFVSRETDHRLFAAAGLMRCCAMIRGIRALAAKDLGPLTVVIGRSLWETWLMCLYVLLAGKPAMEEIIGDDVFWKRRFLEPFADESYGEWNGTAKKLNVKELSKKLHTLLIEAEKLSPSEPERGYKLIYSAFSLFGTHANLSTVSLYVAESSGGYIVIPTPDWPVETVEHTSAIYTAHLAKFVFRAFGLSTDKIETIGAGLLIKPNDARMR